MIQTEELRVGNITTHGTVIGIMPCLEYGDKKEICCMDKLGGIGYFEEAMVSGIPLSSMILIKLGFGYEEFFDDDEAVYFFGNFYLNDTFQPIDAGYPQLNYNIRYVHELQNVYYTLNKTELTINL